MKHTVISQFIESLVDVTRVVSEEPDLLLALYNDGKSFSIKSKI